MFRNITAKPQKLLLCILLILAGTACRTPRNAGGNGRTDAGTSFYLESSERLGVKLSGKENRRLVECLVSWLGAPYKYGGSTRQGTDCSGMVMSVYNEVFGIALYRSSADQLKNVKEVDLPEAVFGDLVFFKISGNKASHVGIYLGERKFIHSSTSRGVVVNSLDEAYYKKYYLSAGRVITKARP